MGCWGGTWVRLITRVLGGMAADGGDGRGGEREVSFFLGGMICRRALLVDRLVSSRTLAM